VGEGRGRSTTERVFGYPAQAPATEFARISGERVVDGLWDRPGLPDRDRRLLTLAVLATAANDQALEVHLDGALRSGDLTAAQLEEAAIHLAHYAGWPAGARFEAHVRAAVERQRTAWPYDGPVGVVGIGALGFDVAAALVRRGAELLVHDARPEAAASVEGAAPVDLDELAARCSVIGIVVRDDAQVLDVVGQIAPKARPGTILLVHSTVSVDTIDTAADLAAKNQIHLADVGLCRPAGMGSGLVALVGGDAATTQKAKPFLDAVAHRTIHVGPRGAGMVVKAIRNTVLYGAYASVSEGVDIARAAGIDVDALREALDVTGATGSAGLAYQTYREGWLAGEQDPQAPGGTADREGYVQLARKDIDVAIETAARHDVDATFARATSDAMPLAYVTDRNLP
jgi:3-hydroxyisobutyrate dehydrogenase-like beta-hydroxyacid dehydrogenase/alkylhydroperoxidase/carboxymuconolactone decarboxylase family protein YurZ